MFRLLLVLFSVVSCNVMAGVTVDTAKGRFHFEQSIRLAQVLAPIAHKADWYWPAASIFAADVSVWQQKQQATVTLIDQLLAQDDDREWRSSLKALRAEVLSWDLATRLHAPIDYDSARLNPAVNRLIPDGHYRLQLLTRPDNFRVIGAIKRSVVFANTPQILLPQAVDQAQVISAADSNIVYVITPTGQVSQQGVAYYNQHYQQIVPGSTIFVPFAQSWFDSDLQTLNDMVLELAVNRVLP